MSASPRGNYDSTVDSSLSWEERHTHSHGVQFYETDGVLLDRLSRFFGSFLGAGDAGVVIATKAHRNGLVERLEAAGLNVSQAVRHGRFVQLDAVETLAKFMVDGWPDAARFADVIGGVLRNAAASSRPEHLRVAAFGEMVALLWAQGKPEAAIKLEHLWNELAQTQRFHLHCAYPLALFREEGDGASIQKICAEHSHVTPAESYTGLVTEEERLRSILFLQQRAMTLETEIAERKRVQQALEQRDAELRDFLENAVIGMHWVGDDGTILWANRAEMELLGYTREEYLGHHVREFHVDQAVVQDMLQRLSRNEALHGYEARMKCKDGSIRFVRVVSNAFMQDGKLVHTRCFTIDITKEKGAAEDRSRLAAIVESSDDAIASKNLNGIVTSWNASAERIFGYKPEEIIGKPITTIIPSDLQHDEPGILAKIVRGERIEHFETVRLTKDGRRINVSLTVSPVKDENGHVIGAAKIVRDITEKKRTEEALHMTEKLASVGRLAASIAHEINNPLEAVTNYIYLASRTPELPEKVKRHLQFADRELGRVAHIAQQTLGFYRDNSQPAWLNLEQTLQDVLAIYEHKLKYKNLTVECEVEPDLNIFTFQGELKQALSNVIANAIDACQAGGRIRIRVRSSVSRSGLVAITIADNGAGMSRDVQKNIFTAFFTTKPQVGTGLGLWNTRNLLEKRGGSIRIRSREGRGTVVNLLLRSATPN